MVTQVLRLGMASSFFFCWPRQDVILRAGVELGVKVNLDTLRYVWCLVWRTCIQIVQVLQSRDWLRSVHDNMGVDGDGLVQFDMIHAWEMCCWILLRLCCGLATTRQTLKEAMVQYAKSVHGEMRCRTSLLPRL